MSVGISGKERDRDTLFFNSLLERGAFLFKTVVCRLKPLKKLIDIRLVLYQVVNNLNRRIGGETSIFA
jgi:hypothetical protein